MATPIRILIMESMDEHEIARKGLASLCKDTEIAIVADAAYGEKALTITRKQAVRRDPARYLLGRHRLDHATCVGRNLHAGCHILSVYHSNIYRIGLSQPAITTEFQNQRPNQICWTQ